MKWLIWESVAACVLLAILAGVWAAGGFTVRVGDNLVVEVNEPDAEVFVDGDKVTVTWGDGGKRAEIRVKPGKHMVEVKKDGFTACGKVVEVEEGKRTVLTATLLPPIPQGDKPGDAPTGQPFPGKPPAGLLAWWRADGNAKDSVGDNHGTLKGGVKFVRGVARQAFDFNGINGRIDMGNAQSLHLSSRDFSVSAWVNFRSLKRPPGNADGAPLGDMWIVGKMSSATGSNADGWALLKQEDSHFWFGFGGGNHNGLGGDAAPTMIRSTTEVVPGVWYHVVAVKTAGHFSLYVNGIEEASKPLPAFKDTNTADLLLGAAVGPSSHMAGLIDEVTVYSRALIPAEVKDHWRALAPAAGPAARQGEP
jgi:hypothetical protein